MCPVDRLLSFVFIVCQYIIMCIVCVMQLCILVVSDLFHSLFLCCVCVCMDHYFETPCFVH